MKTVYPNYYNSFKCIADKCRHNCCIGWEIDIDESSLEVYQSAEGDFGKRLRDNISLSDTPHFILKENDRCPFLNCHNLCDIYSSLGKDKLCQICSDHPRFYNEFSDRVEAGLGLCCEEAARLIIAQKEPMTLINEGPNPQGLLLLRKNIFDALQNRNLSINARIDNVCEILQIYTPDFDILKWTEVFENLERLDESWSSLLARLKSGYKNADLKDFGEFMKVRETEYEQFLCYLIYRHALKSDFFEDFVLYVLFSVLSYKLVFAMGAVDFTENGYFSVDDQLEIMRLFSSEIEYSDENLDIILEEIENEF